MFEEERCKDITLQTLITDPYCLFPVSFSRPSSILYTSMHHPQPDLHANNTRYLHISIVFYAVVNILLLY